MNIPCQPSSPSPSPPHVSQSLSIAQTTKGENTLIFFGLFSFSFEISPVDFSLFMSAKRLGMGGSVVSESQRCVTFACLPFGARRRSLWICVFLANSEQTTYCTYNWKTQGPSLLVLRSAFLFFFSFLFSRLLFCRSFHTALWFPATYGINY